MFQYELGVFVGKWNEVCAAQSDKNEPNKCWHHFNHVYSPIEPWANKEFGMFGLNGIIDWIVGYLVTIGTLKELTYGQCGHHKRAAVEQCWRLGGNISAKIRQQLFFFFGEQRFEFFFFYHFWENNFLVRWWVECDMYVLKFKKTFTLHSSLFHWLGYNKSCTNHNMNCERWNVYESCVTVMFTYHCLALRSPTMHNVFVPNQCDR